MLENLLDLVKQQAGEAIVNNPAIPNHQNDEAMDTYQEILEIDPTNPMVHLALADYYKSLNNKTEFFKEVRIAFENPELDVETKTKILASYYELSGENAEFKEQGYELCKITNGNKYCKSK